MIWFQRKDCDGWPGVRRLQRGFTAAPAKAAPRLPPRRAKHQLIPNQIVAKITRVGPSFLLPRRTAPPPLFPQRSPPHMSLDSPTQIKYKILEKGKSEETGQVLRRDFWRKSSRERGRREKRRDGTAGEGERKMQWRGGIFTSSEARSAVPENVPATHLLVWP